MMIVKTIDKTIFGFRRWTWVKTFKSSMKIKAVKVMLTMFTKESLKKIIAASMITEP